MGSRYFLKDEETQEEMEIDQDHYYRLWKSIHKRPHQFKGIKIRRVTPKVVMVPNCKMSTN